VNIEFLQDEMAFKNSDECLKFLESKNVLFIGDSKEKLDTKLSYPILVEVSHSYQKVDIKGQL
jgi:hypothetical protein